ncbi:MAG: glycosyltransferase family 39 protein [Gemmatimonadaceae bacterium]|nr:glycosyltransferase family 39 protein [Gemmatimonadaceae bacterium]
MDTTDLRARDGERRASPAPAAPRTAPAPTALADDARPPFAAGIVAALAVANVAIHWLTNLVTPFGVHRDELLYLAMGRHLHLWRMDFPPAIALLARAQHALLGDSLFAIRIVPSLCGAALVVLATCIAREMGGGKYAQAIAALAVLMNGVFLRAALLFQPVVLDQLCWAAALYALARLCRDDDRRWWLALGAALGAGLLSKLIILVLGAAMLAALLLTPMRRALATPWPWLAALLALLIGSPTIVGQVRLGFPIVGQMGELRNAQLEHVSAGEWLTSIATLGPTMLVAAIGAIALLGDRAMRRFRAVGLACVIAFATIFALHGKPYYAAPVYPALFAAGGVWFGRVRGARVGAWVRAAMAVLIVAYGIVPVLPLALPILSVRDTARFAAAIGVTSPLRTNTGDRLTLPQDFADMLGWPEQAAAVAAVYHALPPEQQREAVVLAGNYGEAGAIDLYGPRHGLPPAISTQGTYYLFGPGDRPGRVLITIGLEPEHLARLYDSVRVAGYVDTPDAVPEERHVPILVCTGPRQTLQALWPSLAGRY